MLEAKVFRMSRVLYLCRFIHHVQVHTISVRLC